MVLKKLFNKIKEEKEVIQGEATKDKTYSSENTFLTEEDAIREFKRSVRKLFHVNRWSEMPGITSSFILYHPNGTEKEADKPTLRDYVKIILPGPVPENWVVVWDIQEKDDLAEFTVSPSTNPTKRGEGEKEIEHFFIKEASSTFRVERRGKSIIAFEIGKNEGINNDEKEAGDRQLINTLIAQGGWAGVQKFQWNKLTDYLVHKIEIENK